MVGRCRSIPVQVVYSLGADDGVPHRENIMRILVIEDDASAAAFLVKGLREAGHAVDHCIDGNTGLNMPDPDRGSLQRHVVAGLVELVESVLLFLVVS